jgi:hypothetical protein
LKGTGHHVEVISSEGLGEKTYGFTTDLPQGQ